MYIEEAQNLHLQSIGHNYAAQQSPMNYDFQVHQPSPKSCVNSCNSTKDRSGDAYAQTSNPINESRASYRTETKDKQSKIKYYKSLKSTELEIDLMKDPTNYESQANKSLNSS